MAKKISQRTRATAAAIDALTQKISEAEREKMVNTVTMTGPARPDAFTQALIDDQVLMEKVRQHGVKLTVAGEQVKPAEKLSDAVARDLVGRMRRTPRHYTIGMARPSGMPMVREMMLAHLAYEAKVGAGVKPLNVDDARKWEMYFCTADFTDLFNEMQRDFKDESVPDYLSDIMEEFGPTGQVVVGFDLNKIPVVRFGKYANEHLADAMQPPDPSVWEVPGEPMSRASLAALAFQWRTNAEGGTALFAGMRTTGDTFRAAGVNSESMRDAILIMWMLASKQLRMLESKPQKASQGLPPKAKDKRRTIREDIVTVVTLRRAVRKQVEEVQRAEATHHLSHRFVVRGHWRNQAYGTNRALRRRTYILPYVKGPEGAPFVEREKVYQW